MRGDLCEPVSFRSEGLHRIIRKGDDHRRPARLINQKPASSIIGSGLRETCRIEEHEAETLRARAETAICAALPCRP